MLSAAFEATSQRLEKTPSMSLMLLGTLSKATRSCRPQEVLDPNPYLYLSPGLCEKCLEKSLVLQVACALLKIPN